MPYFDFLILGGGLASARCAERLRKEGAEGSIAIISADRYRPYHRPPLSKGLLLGYEQETEVFVHKEEFYRESGTELVLGRVVTSLDSDDNVVRDEQGEEFGFGKLLLATGATPRRLEIEGGGLDGISYLRNLDDSLAIKAAMGKAKNAVIIGAGFIGMELASAFAQNGVKTTMLVREDRLFGKLDSPEISEFFGRLYREKGVSLLFGEEAATFEGNGHVESVVTKSGRTFPADLVAVGVGVVPVTGFLEGSGIEIENGIVTDEYLKTSRDDVFAAGDVASFFDPVFGKRRRIEHWDNAQRQGRLAATNMLGKQTAYGFVSYFFSDLFELSFDFLGESGDVDEIVYRGSFDEAKVTAYYTKGGAVKAAFLLMGEPADRERAERLILEGAGPD